MVECQRVYEAAGNEYIHPDDWVEGKRPFISMGTACSYITLFEAIANRAGPNLNYATFREAGYTLGEQKQPGNPELSIGKK